MSIAENIQKIRAQIDQTAANCGKNPQNVALMAVSKFHPVEEIEQAVLAGQKLFGENRVQEACEKFPQLLEKYSDIELHMIGHLQRNKVKDIVKIASCIHSVDSVELIKEIEKQTAKIDKKMRIFLEIHTGEDTKSGFTSESDVEAAVEFAKDCPHIEICGLMTMAPLTEDAEIIKNSFLQVAALAQKLNQKYAVFANCSFSQLSMGMSGDFAYAIEAGSTVVRVGTAIFGERNYNK